MTEYPYQPPAREFADTLLAYRDFGIASTWSARVEPDPLGPVNKIVRLMRGSTPVKAALARVPAGASVRLVRDEGAWSINHLTALRNALWDTRGGKESPKVDAPLPPGWRIEIDGDTVLSVTDTELRPPYTPPPPPPLHRRLWTALREQARTDTDRIAALLGYHRDDKCGSDW